MQFSNRSKLLALVSTVLFGLLLFVAGCSQTGKPTPPTITASPTPAVTPVVTASFVGDASCKDCHAAEFGKHEATAHAATMRVMSEKILGPLAPKDGAIPGTDIVMSRHGDDIHAGLTGVAGSLPLTHAIGSGKSGMTYISLMEDDRLIEMHKSYFPGTKHWYTTPAHPDTHKRTVGSVYTRNQTAQCLMCHVVTLPDDSNQAEPKFLGVGCEACHGPGGAHIAAASTKGATDLKMLKLGALPAAKLNELCGRCHRTVADVMNKKAPNNLTRVTMTNRFQPYGIMTSPCYLKSGGKLSCLTCHDPHTNSSTDHKMYEVACLKCHSPVHTDSATQGKPCPVNPTTGCIPCHMPRRPIFANGIPQPKWPTTESASIASSKRFSPALEPAWTARCNRCIMGALIPILNS